MIFYWTAWNIDHIGKHGVDQEEAADVAAFPRSPYPTRIPDDKRQVRGQTRDGRYLQVIYSYPRDEDIEVERLSPAERIRWMNGEDVLVFVIHARDLTNREKQSLRRNRRQ